MKTRKPWLNYHKPGAPVREFHEPPKKPRELFWARFWLIVGMHAGAHFIYLRKFKSAVLWFLAFQGILLFLLIFIAARFPEDDERIVSIIVPLIWIVVIAFEYRRLPQKVKTANEKIFGRRVIHDERLQGEIGPYGAMRPVMLLCLISFLVYFVSLNALGDDNLLVWAAHLFFMISLFIAFRKYSAIKKQPSQGSSID